MSKQTENGETIGLTKPLRPLHHSSRLQIYCDQPRIIVRGHNRFSPVCNGATETNLRWPLEVVLRLLVSHCLATVGDKRWSVEPRREDTTGRPQWVDTLAKGTLSLCVLASKALNEDDTTRNKSFSVCFFGRFTWRTLKNDWPKISYSWRFLVIFLCDFLGSNWRIR